MEKLWLKNYEQGVAHEINLNEYGSLIELFNTSCVKHKEKIAYSNMGTDLTYAELDRLSMNFAQYLHHIGLKKGTRVAIMLPNLLQYPIALLGILRAGCIVVNTNPLYTSDEVTYQLKDAGAQAIVVLANFAQTLEKSLPQLPQLKHIIITELGDAFPPIKKRIVNAVVKYIKRMVPVYTIKNSIPFQETLQQLPLKKPYIPKLNHDDIAFLQYTGGTTGISKGAVLTHANLLANILQARAWLSPLNLNENDIIVTALPLYHIFSLTANCLTFLSLGSKNILITNPRDMPRFIHDIKKSNFTVITGVNTLFNALLNHPLSKTIDFSHLKFALSGGMALQKSVAMAWEDRTQSKVLEAYGLTETSPAITINPLSLEHYNGSIGLPLPSTDISIRDDNGHECAPGESGELCVKGPQVMPGYWQREDETALVFWEDGFLRTGDIAKMDEQGFFYLVDRKKDMILVSGFNVYPNEIEQVIGLMPGVLEVGVVGVNETETSPNEKVKACIVKRDPELTAEQVIAYCREHLTAYKVPKIISFYNELPKTNVGKILRRELKSL